MKCRQILINLIGNAVKFTEVGKIRVLAWLLDADSGQSQMQFDIIDTGIGMTEEQVDKLFQPFSIERIITVCSWARRCNSIWAAVHRT